jgi:hypothetical protein
MNLEDAIYYHAPKMLVKCIHDDDFISSKQVAEVTFRKNDNVTHRNCYKVLFFLVHIYKPG